MRASKKNDAFATFASLMSTSMEGSIQDIPCQYQELKDAFEKKNANMLAKYRLYDCSIELQEGTQPPFRPLYNLSQTKLAAFENTLMRTYPRVLFVFEITN